MANNGAHHTPLNVSLVACRCPRECDQMERWLDTKANYWACGFLFLAVCLITYAACRQCDVPHPVRMVLIVAIGLVLVILMVGGLFVAVFAPLCQRAVKTSHGWALENQPL